MSVPVLSSVRVVSVPAFAAVSVSSNPMLPLFVRVTIACSVMPPPLTDMPCVTVPIS